MILTTDPLSPKNDSKCLLVTLEDDEIQYLHYLGSFRVIKGAIELFGSVHFPSSQYETIVIPPWSGSYCFRRARLSSIINIQNRNQLTHDHLRSKEDIKNSRQCLRCGSYCGAIQSELCQYVQQLDPQNSSTCILFKDSTTAFGTVKCCDVITTRNSLFDHIFIDTLPIWNQLTAELILSILTKNVKSEIVVCQSIRAVIMGHQGVGKSSFCCFLINSLLSIFDRITLLDTDIGQPLLTIPGITSLHVVSKPLLGGPHSLIESLPKPSNFSQASRSTEILSVFIGDVTPEVDPRLYLASIGQCTLSYMHFVSGALEIGESVKNGISRMNEINNNNQDQKSILSPHCRPSQSLLLTGSIPERLLIGDGSDPKLKDKMINAVSQFVKIYSNNMSLPQNINNGDDKIHMGSAGINNHLSLEDTSLPLMPLILNTHGWISGLGWQLIEAIGALSWATHAVEIVKSEDWRTLETDKWLKNNELKDVQQHSTKQEAKVDSTTKSLEEDPAEIFSFIQSFVASNSLTKKAQVPDGWGPLTTPLSIGSQFVDIVEQFCGRLPLGIDKMTQKGIQLIRCAYDNSTSQEKQLRLSSKDNQVKSEHLRWLKFMSYFNSSYRYAVHFPVATPEEFFHGISIPSTIRNESLFSIGTPRLISIRLHNPDGRLRFRLSCSTMSSASLKELSLTDALFALTGSLVALGADNDLLGDELWVPQKPWKFLGLLWLHSVDIVTDRLIAYAPKCIGIENIEKANILCIGHRYNFTPMPEGFHHKEIFPHYEVVANAIDSLYPYLKSSTNNNSNISRPPITKTVIKTVKADDRYGDQSENVIRTTYAGNTPFNQEFVFSLNATVGGKSKSRRRIIKRKCHI